MFVALEAKKPRHGNNISVLQQINDKEEVVHVFNRIVLSHIKNAIMPFVAKWMELEIIIVNEVNQTEKKTYIIRYCLNVVSKKKTSR